MNSFGPQPMLPKKTNKDYTSLLNISNVIHKDYNNGKDIAMGQKGLGMSTLSKS